MNNIEKLNEQEKKYKKVFSELFGFNRQKKEKPTPQQSVLFSLAHGGYQLGQNYIDVILADGSNEGYYFTSAFWLKPENAWMLNAKFKANVISVKRNGIHFNGVWESGKFEGVEFLGKASRFVGGEFHGKIYSAPNETYEADPDTYYTGVFKDNENGILGEENYRDEIENTEKIIQLIQVPVGWYVILVDSRNHKKVIFKVLKKIDYINTDIILQTIPDRKKIVIKWEKIRSNYLHNGFIIKKKSYCVVDEICLSEIQKIYVKKEIPLLINFNSDKRLGWLLKLKRTPLTFEVRQLVGNASDFANTFVEDLAKGVFYDILKNIKTKINSGKINGYGEFDYLFSLFNGNRGKNIQDEKTLRELEYLDNFINYILDNAVSDTINVKKQVIKSLQAYFGLDKSIQKQQQVPLQNVNNIIKKAKKNI